MSQIKFSHVLGRVEVHDGTYWRPAYVGLTMTTQDTRIMVRTGPNAAATVWRDGASAELSGNTLASIGGPVSQPNSRDWKYWTGYVWSKIATALGTDPGREFPARQCGGGIRG
jgi:hypothetical protein